MGGVTSARNYFTSCGTEANNWILRSAVEDLKIKQLLPVK
jgi:cysteine desulfurase